MLGIRRLEHLQSNLGVSAEDLHFAVEFADEDVRELRLFSPFPGEKPRNVISVRGTLRHVQERLFQRVLKTKLHPSPYSNGGVRGRNVLKNAHPHLGSSFILKLDISSFYPSISTRRVNRFFIEKARCSPAVARYLTRICSYDHHLALGLVTSPILADQILHDVDKRIGALCQQRQLSYTRWVDDVTISGRYDFGACEVPSRIKEIFSDHGFRVSSSKSDYGPVHKSVSITGIRVDKPRLDVEQDYVAEVERQIRDHASLASGDPFHGPLQSESQLAGRVHYICWVNPGRRFRLRRQFRAINWDAVWQNAQSLGLVVAERRLVERDAPEPCFDRCFANGKTPVQLLRAQSRIDERCPF